ncbi:MAG TPA: hypothetical protein VNW99_11570, partial [Cytophagaceae bacterium]|nr:hypothetical protein [Cytophagaceae bacterium]
MKARLIIYLFFATFIVSCSDIFEHNLSHDVVNIYGPANNTISQSYSQQYWWGAVKSATQYNLQIAKPSFDSTGSYILDTIIKSTKVTYSLRPGTYQWRVRAENGSSHTNYVTYSIRIDTGSLANQSIVLLSPDDNLITNNAAILFKWQGVYGASKYEIVIDSGSTTSLFSDSIISTTSYNPSIYYAFSKDRVYYWKVRGINGAVSTAYSPLRSFTLDRIGPDSVPMPNSSSTLQVSPVALQWGSVIDADTFQVYIYNQANGIGLLSGFPVAVPSPTLSYSFSTGTSGKKYYWVVIA